jgi:SAM-dependent methyltransferase
MDDACISYPPVETTFLNFAPLQSACSVIEVGAGNGIQDSFSRLFVERGWRAILAEGEQNLFQQLTANSAVYSNARCLFLSAESSGAGIRQVLESEHWPSDIGLLIVRTMALVRPVLDAFDVNRFRPAVIICADDGPDRRQVYGFLTQKQYSFAGARGNHAFWVASAATGRNEAARDQTTFEDLGKNSVEGGTVYFDGPIAAGGHNTRSTYVSVGRELVFSGWAIETPGTAVPPHVYVRLENEIDSRAACIRAYRVPRPDVAAHFRCDGLLLAGFRAGLRTDAFRPGSYAVSVIQISAHGALASRVCFKVEFGFDAREADARSILAKRFLFGSGIEIGALQRPLAVPDGCAVRYVDRMTVQDLRAHYPELAGSPITEPDLIDDGERLNTLAIASLDFVIANHFLEHCTDPIRTIANLMRVLKPGGVLYMAVPDKRFTFDRDRPDTDFARLARTYERGERSDRNELYQEWCRSVMHLSGDAVHRTAADLESRDYSIHYNVWTIETLLDFLVRSKSSFELPFTIASAIASENEVILILEKNSS